MSLLRYQDELDESQAESLVIPQRQLNGKTGKSLVAPQDQLDGQLDRSSVASQSHPCADQNESYQTIFHEKLQPGTSLLLPQDLQRLSTNKSDHDINSTTIQEGCGEEYDPGIHISQYTQEAMTAIAEENMLGLREIIQKIHTNARNEAGDICKELEDLFSRFSSQQMSIAMQSLNLFSEAKRQSANFTKTPNRPSTSQASPLVAAQSSAELSKDCTNQSKNNNVNTPDQERSIHPRLLPRASLRRIDSTWSESWKKAVEGVLRKHRRQRICDMAMRRVPSSPNRKVVPKSENAKERLRKILKTHFLLGDLDDALREQLVDAFQDLRVPPETEVVKLGESADFFYVIDVGEVDILTKKGSEPYTVVQTKGTGESFGELALMYDTVRNITVQTKTHCLLWSIDRPTFKSTISRHLSGSQIAQVLRESPTLKAMSTRDIVKMSQQCSIQHFIRGQQILRAGQPMDKFLVIQEGQVRVGWGAAAEGKPSGGGDMVALLGRLQILGDALLLNEETLNPWNYVASSDQVELIMMNRSLLDSDLMKVLRKGLQVQLITLALQRVPAFLELESEQLSNLAASFTESLHKRGEMITTAGNNLGADTNLYVVQKGSVLVQKSSLGSESMGGGDVNLGNSWGSLSRIGSFLKGSPTISSPGLSLVSPSHPNEGSSKPSVATALSRRPSSSLDGPSSSNMTQNATNPSVDQKSRSSMVSGQYWKFSTYAVFGDEFLQDESYSTCQLTTISDTVSGVICLSISMAIMASILGPINELVARVSNLRTLRKVPCLEYLKSQELDILSHSMGLRKVKIGDVIYQLGELMDRLYVVNKGSVVEVKKSPKDGKVEEQIFVKGSYFGDEALIKPNARSKGMILAKSDSSSTPVKTELYYLDRAVLEANLGALQELNEIREKNAEKNGLLKRITLEELEEIGLLGTGLLGKVKLVYSRRTQDFYALKCVKKAQVIKMQEEEHLRNEKMSMSELDHPFITKLIRTFKDEKYIYLLEELTVGRELFLFMEKVGRLQEWEAAFYAGGVLLALEYMHGKGIVYRDLKPENTLIGENGYPKLIDMGFTKRIYNRRTFSMCGTPDYMAPEIIKRTGHGKAVDFWALGCLIFEMITNTSPFNKGSDPPQVVFQNITEGNFRFPTYVSPVAVDIISSLLDPNPETRLGCRSHGIVELKEHAFFTKEIDFEMLIRQREEAPMIPPKVTDYRKLCIADRGSPSDNHQYDNMTIVSQHDIHWDDIF